MKLYDTALRDYAQLKGGKRIGIYVCGITPYDAAHLGHIFTFITYDLLVRRLEDMGHEVRLVRNITDVDEPIYKRAAELGIPYTELAEREIESFESVMQKLNFKKPFTEPRASDYIEQMAEAVQELLGRGFAYHVGQDVYFDVSKFPDFGKLSGFSEKVKIGLASMRGGDPKNPDKRNPLDFLLWKNVSDPSDPAQWQTAIGNGRPGWHIECTVMSAAHLGTSFDIHGGGSDLIFPHHSAEIAQSYGLGRPNPAKHWVHVSPLFSDGEKMSKSLGNLIFAKDLLKHHEPSAIRLALMFYYHRIGGEWQPELMKEAEDLLKAFRASAQTASLKSSEKLLYKVRAALDDDLDTHEVIHSLREFAASEAGNPEESKEAARKTFDLLGLSF